MAPPRVRATRRRGKKAAASINARRPSPPLRSLPNRPPKLRLIKKNTSRIQLVPILNPRFLYYICQLSNDEYFWEVEELNGLTIPESLLDLCVGILSDDAVVSDKLKKIPVTKIEDIEYHLEVAFKQMPKGTNFYSALIPVNCTEASDKSSQVSVNWILYNMIWADNDQLNPLWWENYWGEFHGAYFPKYEDSIVQAEKILRSPFFKIFLKYERTFMESAHCNVRSSILLVSLYENGGQLFDPYGDRFISKRNKKNKVNLSQQDYVDMDFKLDKIMTPDFFKDCDMTVSEQHELYEDMFNKMMIHWKVKKYNFILLLQGAIRTYKNVTLKMR